ncbi:type I-E CRISPR-associated protein Cse1/CasA [Desulfuromonas thiophila]|uniref:type I-E CRISPR-associated protein Cse1/CasA n=1 Tax=Desulfuromonas thiophila TaxID=57664 RepID=UPI0029F4F3AF|nr:type I-E CRISPR-associated protein Cse1/CasA [Desulfuromonas thiophila]
MNLIRDAWIPVIRANSGRGMIAPWQIAEQEDPVMELATPRPDFQGAMYQFLIGLLQTGFAPEDLEEWLEYWSKPPDTALLRTKLETLTAAFEFDKSDGPAFMQDYEMPDGEKKGIASLLIEAPGGKTVKDNLDHFVKRDAVRHVCKSCAAMALFTLQTNAPSGGVGHRVGLRGGGPLTTLVLPPEQMPLWQTLWLNILDREDMPGYRQDRISGVFPWMGPTRTSDKNGVETSPESVHELQVYWGMPRRIRLDFPIEPVTGDCDLCDAKGVALVEAYRTRNYGVNYVGNWVHPLTPYRFDPKKESPPLSTKGQPGGLGYRHFIALTLANDGNGYAAAKVVRRYTEQRAPELKLQRIARLWCFGFDMDNMKARCWYDHTFPLFNLAPQQRKKLLQWTDELITGATDVGGFLRKQVKAAWFRRPEDIKDIKNTELNPVVIDFWQRSESDFYELLKALSNLPSEQDEPPPELYAKWKNRLVSLSLELFDVWVLEASLEDMDIKRVIEERDKLIKLIHGCKSMKLLNTKATPVKEEANEEISIS